MGVEVKVKFFASGRELTGTTGYALELPDDAANTESVTKVRPPNGSALNGAEWRQTDGGWGGCGGRSWCRRGTPA